MSQSYQWKIYEATFTPYPWIQDVETVFTEIPQRSSLQDAVHEIQGDFSWD